MAEEIQEYLDLNGLTEYHSKVNDMTTGINLLRGTRDFKAGSQSRVGYGFSDGFNNGGNFTITKDPEGFGVASLENPNSNGVYSYSSYVEGFDTGDKYTLSFEYKYNKASDVNNIAYIIFYRTYDGEQEEALVVPPNKNTRVGEWNQVVYNFKIPWITSDCVMLAAMRVGNGADISYRRFMLQRGTINNPIWSQSPFDTAASSGGSTSIDFPIAVRDGGTGATNAADAKKNLGIQDYTTGINLLRGTRDFTVGTVRNNYNSALFVDGFSPNNNVQNEKGEDGYTYLKYTGSSATILYASAITGVTAGQQLTLSFEYMIKDKTKITNNQLGGLTPYNGTTNIPGGNNYNIDSNALESINLNTWYKAVLHVTVPDNFSPDNGVFAAFLRLHPDDSVRYRLLSVYLGNIDKPIWSPSSFDFTMKSDIPQDVADLTELKNSVKAIEDGVPELLGTRKEITSGTDLDNMVLPGSYRCGGSIAKTLTNTPIEYDGSTAFTLDVKLAIGVADSPTHPAFVDQFITNQKSGDSSVLTYFRHGERTSTSPIKYTWTEWRETYLNTQVRPTEGGGTGWTHGLNSGVNLIPGTSSEWSRWITPTPNTSNFSLVEYANIPFPKERNRGDLYTRYIEIEFEGVTATEGQSFLFNTQGAVNNTWSYENPIVGIAYLHDAPEDGVYIYRDSRAYTEKKVDELETFNFGFRCDYWASGRFRYRCLKLERGKVDYPQWTPAPSDLVLKGDNETSLGINLLRGTRDFATGIETDKSGRLFDGWLFASSFTKSVDNDGFTVATSGLATASIISNIVRDVNTGDKFTLSYFVKFDGTIESSQFDGYPWVSFYPKDNLTADNSTRITSVSWDRSTLNFPPQDLKTGVWYHVVTNFTVPNLGENKDAWFTIALNKNVSNLPSATVSFKKPVLQSGTYNNLVWTPAPSDLVLEPVNDLTTGINLLRGTRDFSSGKEHHSNTNYFKDGYLIQNNSVVTMSKDNDGFNVATLSRTDATSSVPTGIISSVIEKIHKHKYVTINFKIKTDNPSSFDSSNHFGAIIIKDELGANRDQYNLYNTPNISVPNFNNMEAGKWYDLVYTYKIPDNVQDTDYLILAFQIIKNGTFSIKKCSIYDGIIEHPVWSQSPFDVALLSNDSSFIEYPIPIGQGGTGAINADQAKENLGVQDYTTGVNLLKRTRDFKKGIIKKFDFMTSFLEDGWAYNSDSWKLSSDENGFSVISITRTDLSANAVMSVNSAFIPCKPGDRFTMGVQFMTTDFAGITDKNVFTITCFDESGTEISTPTGSYVNATSDCENEWQLLKTQYEITDPKTAYFAVRLRLARNGNLNYKMPFVIRGYVNNPIYSPNPNDADYINDYTTGINLVRGTRDFRHGSESKIMGDIECFLDGFNLRAYSQYATFYKDSDGFGVAHLHNGNLGSSSTVDLNAPLFHVENTGMYTVSVEIMVDNIEEWNAKSGEIIVARSITDSYAAVDRTGRTFAQAGYSNPENSQWYKIVFQLNLTSESQWFEVVLRAPGNGSIHYRKLMVQEGNIHNPIYAPNPNDIDYINDETTGINLLCGTRSFRQAIYTPLGGFPGDGFKKDGAGAGWTYSKDDEGFTIASCFQEDLTEPKESVLNASLVPVEYGETYTLFCECMVDDLASLTNSGIFPYYLFEDGNKDPIKQVANIPVTDMAPDGIESGKWAKLCYHVTIDMPNAKWLLTRGRLLRNGSIHFRKMGVYKGRINHPVWSASPFDIDHINDMTTATNLFRGTRDFKSWTSNTKDAYIPGVIIAKSTTKVDSDGFTSIVTDGTSDFQGAYITSNAYGVIKKGDILTFSWEAIFKQEYSSIYAFFAIFKGNNSDRKQALDIAPSSNVNFKTYPPINGKFEANVRYKIVLYIPVTADIEEGNTFTLKAQTTNCPAEFRKYCANVGFIDNPVWSTSPFDIVSSYDWNTQVPMPLGRPDDTHFLTGTENLNNIITAGAYVADGNSYPDTMSGLPEDYGSKGAFKLTVSYVRPRKDAGQNNFVKQVLEAYQHRYERTSDGEAISGNTKWREWVYRSNANGLVPTVGGGTGTTTGIAQRKQIVNDLDLNTLVDEGAHYVNASSVAQTLKNNPNNGPFDMFVIKTNGEGQSSYGQISQVMISPLHMYLRGYTDRWNTWGTVLTDNSPHSYNSGLYAGVSISTKFKDEIGSTHIATWLSNRVKAGNFEGINIGDYVDISCDGVSMRYRVGAIDPYYGCCDQQMGHHIAMIPDAPWSFSSEKDGSYAVNTTNVYWNVEANNNGTSEKQHPYIGSNLHKWEIEKMLPRFPQQWQDAMLNHRLQLEKRFSASSKLTDSNGWGWVDIGKIWSPSEVEVYGQNVWGTKGYSDGLDCQFPIFKQTKGRIARGSSLYRVNYWLRTVVSGSSENVCNTNAHGPANRDPANYSGVRALPCFMIG